ncbi:MAG: hypothetical protein QM724_04920 [Flavobacteriales bacterium]
MFRSSLSLIAVVVALGAQAQGTGRFTQENGDCTGAIFLSDSINVQEKAPRGFGNILEIKENPIEDKQWLEREHNTVWYTFRAPVKTLLTFDIIPKDIEDDIDFLLFRGAVPGICEKIRNKQVQPVRTNISRNDKSIRSMCGLSKDAVDEFVRSGVGASYSKAIDVEAGELFYLLVDYQDRPRDGYTIHFHYDPPPPPPPPPAKEARTQELVDPRDRCEERRAPRRSAHDRRHAVRFDRERQGTERLLLPHGAVPEPPHRLRTPRLYVLQHPREGLLGGQGGGEGATGADRRG